jgi:hypothetical protein
MQGGLNDLRELSQGGDQ